MLAVFATLLVLLREVLLPFVSGMVLAYLLNPLAQTIERRGLNRLVATLLILAFVVIAVTVLLILLIPVIVREVAYFIENLPLYVRQLQTLATDPGRPWLSKIIGEGLAHAEDSLGELTTLVSDWFSPSCDQHGRVAGPSSQSFPLVS